VIDTPQGISVGRLDDRICIRVVGRGTFQNSQPVRQFVLEMIEQGQREFVVDLGQCQGLDSTFLGVLGGLGLRLRDMGHPLAIHVININDRQAELLQTLGLDRLLDIHRGERPIPDNIEFHPLPDADVTHLTHPLTKAEAADLILEAHDDLIRASEGNVPQFKELTKTLRDAVEKHRAAGKHKP
jgi:anti-anti-sigma regulatory factor